MSQRVIVHKEIKRGGMVATIERDPNSIMYLRIKYKDQVREYETSNDMDQAQMDLYDRCEEWVNELKSIAQNKPFGT